MMALMMALISTLFQAEEAIHALSLASVVRDHEK